MTACVNHFILDQGNILAFISHRPPHHSMRIAHGMSAGTREERA
jgi:hypothetical protein